MKNNNNISSVEELEKSIAGCEAAAVYFSTPHCNVCKVLKPKLIEFLNEEFPKIEFMYIDLELVKEAAGKHSVFTVPTVIFFFGGKELIRKSRNFSLAELSQSLTRPYNMIFS